MANLILTTMPEPIYDDLPEFRYHFPKTYLNEAEKGVGDWIIYYEPRRTTGGSEVPGGRQSYFATARVLRIEEDTETLDHFYAYVSDYLEFERSVPFREGGHFYEGRLRKLDGSTNKGLFGRSIRTISPEEYRLILAAGFPTSLSEGSAIPGSDPESVERPNARIVTERPLRERAFTRMVRSAYRSTCSMTGLSIINGENACEAHAAHIRPVGNDHNGPDSVRNGILLSRTLHWVFDRGFISIADDYTILTAECGIPDPVMRMLRDDRKLLLPERQPERPHPKFLSYHREVIFKG